MFRKMISSKIFYDENYFMLKQTEQNSEVHAKKIKKNS
jgi:hypothetical protein